MRQPSFSFDELRGAAKVSVPPVQSLTSADGTSLAYRCYAPPEPRAVLLFYHGGGAHSAAGYQFLGHGLQEEYETVVVTPDIRGHGASEGPRGDAPTPHHVWEDLSTFIRFLRGKFPGVPLVLGGHSSGAGLTLNYVTGKNREAVDGYVFLSPQLGMQAKADRPSVAAPFARVDPAAFAAYGASGGTTHGHDYAVHFNYPAEVLKSDPGLVSAITVTMSVALVPSSPSEQFASLNLPFGLWIGTDDELFLPERVLAFGSLANDRHSKTRVGTIEGGRHLSVLVQAHRTLGPWILDAVG
ncbi:MAG TPA: alpha/beta fold hydrolase [Bacteroidota bacterium]|nr:alpha/beta fold hydrolase [Bacteroidota bacterium]